MIPYGRQNIDASDIDAVVDVLKSEFLTQGPRIGEFEEKVAAYCGAQYAVAVCNGTAALHLAVLALGLKPGDKVIVPSLTFLASVNCIEYIGATPVFVDVDPNRYSIDIEHLQRLLESHPETKAIIVVHFAGLPAPLLEVRRLADRYGVRIIEDACHAFGSEYLDNAGWKRTGAGTASDLTVFSFHPVKHITTGEGGMVLTNSPSLRDRISQLRSHGMVRGTSSNRPWQYQMEVLGYNYRITDLQCALGLSQLKKINRWVEARREVSRAYDFAFKEHDRIRTPIAEMSDARSSFHLYVIQVEERDSLYHYLRKNGIAAQIHYWPVHRQPYYQKKYGTQNLRLSVTDSYAERCLSLPCFAGLPDKDIEMIATTVKEFQVA